MDFIIRGESFKKNYFSDGVKLSQKPSMYKPVADYATRVYIFYSKARGITIA